MVAQNVGTLNHIAARNDPDAALVAAVRAGNSHAYGDLIGRYQARIYTLVVNRVRDPEDALDLTQEIFVKAYRGLEKFRTGSSFYTWLYRIALNHCIDFVRQRKAAPEVRSLADAVFCEAGFEPVDGSPYGSPERVLANQHLRAAIRTAIAAVPEPYRTAVVLYYIEGLSQEQVASIMETPLGTVKTRIHRGRRHLREHLREFVEAE